MTVTETFFALEVRDMPRATAFSGSRTIPNFVASTTSLRRSAIAWPTSVSFVCGP